GPNPRVEDYLGDTTGPERAALLVELLKLDINYRLSRGEQPTAHDYQERFADAATFIDKVFQYLRAADWPRIDGYEVQAEIGAGGMGRVYRAWQLGLERPVAIKVMLPGMPSERFLREAKLLAQISAQHVVAVHDYRILPDGRPVLIMQWVEGTNLWQAM